MLGPFATASRRTPHCHSPGVTACASMSTTTTTTTTTRNRGDRYGPMEWAQQPGHAVHAREYREIVQQWSVSRLGKRPRQTTALKTSARSLRSLLSVVWCVIEGGDGWMDGRVCAAFY